jgi:hypothetical protein
VIATRALVAAPNAPRQATVYFDDSRADLVVLGNPTYEMAFRKSNGAMAYVTDKSTGQHVTEGSASECLWGVSLRGSTSAFVGGNNYDAAGPNRFRYTWMPDSHALRLSYDPDPRASQRVSAEVLVTPSDGAWCDMRLHLENHTGAAVSYVFFPFDLAFVEDDIQEALLPVLPGVVLEKRFFAEHRSFTAQYPGNPGVFADYLALSSNKGRVALYAIHDAGPIWPTAIGFVHDDQYLAGGTLMRHTFGADVEDGQAWTSPPVRLRMSEPFLDTVRDYRVDNALDKMRSLRQKLGPRYAQVAQSPLYKADAGELGMRFGEYGSLLSSLPSPGILHLVGFQPGGHDHSYPDLLPPDPAFGSTTDFVRMCRQAQAAGLLVMPYTNPTWWNDASPTLQFLPSWLHIEDLAVVEENGRPRYEMYSPNGGYAMSPFSPFVQDRLAELVWQMTVTVPSDLLFEDQIGARPWLFDYNVYARDASTYIDGWLQHTRQYSDRLLMTELGFDRLAETEVALGGSVLLTERLGLASAMWGTDTWHVFPLAPMMTRDKVLFYQHDLAETMTSDTVTLTWNLAFGYMLSYNIAGDRTNPFFALAAAFQKHVLALYASERITNFEHVSPTVTRTSFESFKVTANWDYETSFSDGKYTLPPAGVMTRSDDGTVTAGVFSTFNGVALSPGNHYLIERRDASGVSVYQPIGPDTSFTVKRPAGWNAGEPIVGWACNSAGEIVGSVPLSMTADGITFTWRRQTADLPPQAARIRLPGQSSASRDRPLPAGVQPGARAVERGTGRADDGTVYVVRIERAAASRRR